MSGRAAIANRTAVSAGMQERIRAFTSFYEQHAYLAYNLALRIACEQDAAMRAAGRGFLSQLDEKPAGLVPAVANAAINEAPRRPDPAGAGDADAQRLLSVLAELAAPERAALALADLADADPAAIGEALRIDADNAAKLLHRGRESFAARLGLPRPQADEAAREWLWAAPPNEIWEELYPRFHRAAERQAHRGRFEDRLAVGVAAAEARSDSAGEATPALGADAWAAGVGGGRPRLLGRLRGLGGRRPQRWRWSRRTRWEIVLPAAALLMLGGAAATRLADGGSSAPAGAAGADTPIDVGAGVPGAGAAGADSAAEPVKRHKPLTPAELDKLRLRELRQLRNYTRRQADRRLPAGERSAAARGIRALQRAADRRLRAQQRREDALREQLARERARSKAPPPPPSSRSRTPAPTRDARPRPSAPSTSPPSEGPNRDTCLLNEETGAYYCPQ